VFAARGYQGATTRAIAHEAKVDSALIHYFFGTKEALFRTAVEEAFDARIRIDDALASGSDGVGERLVRGYLKHWSTPEGREPILAVLRSALSHGDAARMFRECVSERGIGHVVKVIDAPDAPFRAALIGAQLMGIVMLRYALAIEPLASADPEAIVASLGPTIDRYLTGEFGSNDAD
jgi:AcrR family transcriptional regulator